tara:strand:- start:852 stop:1271 length:420 start_codon:yes stop_codon:yes gene_type:complete
MKIEGFTPKFKKNRLYNDIMDRHYDTDIYDNKIKLKKCCNKNCKTHANYTSENCKKNKKTARQNLRNSYKPIFTKKEFEKIRKKKEEKYKKVKNELDLSKIKLKLNTLPEGSTSYNKIINDQSYVTQGQKLNLYPISVN